MNVVIHFDGVCLNNGQVNAEAAYGWFAVNNDTLERVGEGYQDISEPFMTNNVAEYYGLIRAVEWIESAAGVASARVYGDSQLVINQVFGSWQCNKDHLRTLRDRALESLDRLRSRNVAVTGQWIPREQNAEADRLSNLGLLKCE